MVHQRCSGLRNLRRAGDNLKCLTCVREVVVVTQKLEVGDDSLDIVSRQFSLSWRCDFMQRRDRIGSKG